MNMAKTDVKAKLIEAGVKNLREFGYPQVTKDNILTVMIYKAFFKRMLEDDDNEWWLAPSLKSAIQASMDEFGNTFEDTYDDSYGTEPLTEEEMATMVFHNHGYEPDSTYLAEFLKQRDGHGAEIFAICE